MNQEQILETLNERLGQTSLSSRTISEYVAKNLPGEGEEFDFERHTDILKSLNGNFSHDVAIQVEEFKKNYKPQPTEEKKDADDAQEPSVIEKLLSRIDALEKSASENSRLGRESSLRASVEAMNKTLKVHNENLWKDCVREVSIGDKDTQDDVLKKAKQSYEKKLRDYFGEGAAPYGGKSAEQSQSEKKQSLDKREQLKAKLKAQGKL